MKLYIYIFFKINLKWHYSIAIYINSEHVDIVYKNRFLSTLLNLVVHTNIKLCSSTKICYKENVSILKEKFTI